MKTLAEMYIVLNIVKYSIKYNKYSIKVNFTYVFLLILSMAAGKLKITDAVHIYVRVTFPLDSATLGISGFRHQVSFFHFIAIFLFLSVF